MHRSFPVFCIPDTDEFYPPTGILRSKCAIINLLLFNSRAREFHPLVASL